MDRGTIYIKTILSVFIFLILSFYLYQFCIFTIWGKNYLSKKEEAVRELSDFSEIFLCKNKHIKLGTLAGKSVDKEEVLKIIFHDKTGEVNIKTENEKMLNIKKKEKYEDFIVLELTLFFYKDKSVSWVIGIDY